MKKLKLYGLKKDDNHCVYYIKKSEYFLEQFRKFLHSLDFKKLETAELLGLLGDSDNNYSTIKYSDILYQDRYFYFENDDYKIDVFFGKKIVVASIFSTSEPLRAKSTEHLLSEIK